MSDPTQLKFLVVDDFATMRRIVRGLLREAGCCDVDEAADGPAALGRLRAHRYDFVVCDIHMPRMSGIELLRAIRADHRLRHLPVLMITATVHPDEVRQAAQLGASGYAVKPFCTRGFAAHVHDILRTAARGR